MRILFEGVLTGILAVLAVSPQISGWERFSMIVMAIVLTAITFHRLGRESVL